MRGSSAAGRASCGAQQLTDPRWPRPAGVQRRARAGGAQGAAERHGARHPRRQVGACPGPSSAWGARRGARAAAARCERDVHAPRPPAPRLQISDLPSRELVPGDVVELTVGDKVRARGRGRATMPPRAVRSPLGHLSPPNPHPHSSPVLLRCPRTCASWPSRPRRCALSSRASRASPSRCSRAWSPVVTRRASCRCVQGVAGAGAGRPGGDKGRATAAGFMWSRPQSGSGGRAPAPVPRTLSARPSAPCPSSSRRPRSACCLPEAPSRAAPASAL
jgi:hypothetical protein